MNAQIRLQRWMRPSGKDAFVRDIPRGGRVFDVGCGNRSPERIKSLRPDLYYIGLDVADYAQSSQSKGMADEYVVVTPDRFVDAIAEVKGTMDAVISAHNLEHCEDPVSVLHHVSLAVKPGGRVYLSFPCAASVNFPSRRGSLRFDDDPTHRTPPDFAEVCRQLVREGLQVERAEPRYRPPLPALLGGVLEPFSMLSRRVMPLGSTWALWGFESLIWARRP